MPVVEKKPSVPTPKPPAPQVKKQEEVVVAKVKTETSVGACDHSFITPELIEKIRKTGYKYQGKWYTYENFLTLESSYKVHNIFFMACKWKGTPMEKFTVPLLAMVIQECGSLDGTACTGKDNGKAWGITQHNICAREFDGKQFCYYGDLDGNGTREATPMQMFKNYIGAEAWASWKSQFFHYSDVVRGNVEGGMSADKIIWSWNSREVGRRAKVARWEPFVTQIVEASGLAVTIQ